MAEASAKHDYQILQPSPWPAIGSLGAFIMLFGAVSLFRWHSSQSFMMFGVELATPWIFVLGLAIVLYTMYAWWSDMVHESLAGQHTRAVSLALRYGVIMFIASEVMFFVAWFWAFFDASLFPNEAIQQARTNVLGGQWPPVGIEVLDPLHLPLFNTITLLLSGTAVTWAHHALLHNDRRGLVTGLALTVGLGLIFTYVQYFEYVHAPFAFAGSIYGSTFFMATGFHGFHVIIGTIFLIVCLIRASIGQFTAQKHFGFEAAAWYWHFVDVVWLFLYFAVYIWGGWGAPVFEA